MTASNTYGRQVVAPLTNKSGGAVIAGDVVIVDATNNDSFTTTTTAGYVKTVGVAQESIANNAVGRVALAGYVPLINVAASVTRGNFGETHTVAKQATDTGSSRSAGTFVQFLTGGTTPDGVIWQPDLGAGASSPLTTKGDLWGFSTVDARVPVSPGTDGMVLTLDSTQALGLKWATGGGGGGGTPATNAASLIYAYLNFR